MLVLSNSRREYSINNALEAKNSAPPLHPRKEKGSSENGKPLLKHGAGGRNRTPDLLITSANFTCFKDFEGLCSSFITKCFN